MWSRLGAPRRTMWSKPESFILIFCIWCILMTVWTACIHFTISKHWRERQDLHFGGFHIWPYSTRSSCLVSYSSSFVHELSDHWLRLSRLCKKTVIIFCCVFCLCPSLIDWWSAIFRTLSNALDPEVQPQACSDLCGVAPDDSQEV